MRMALPAGVRISISFNPLGVAGVFFCFRPVVPANEGTGTKDPLCGSSINGFQKFGILHHAAWLPMQEFYTVTVYEDIHVAVAGVLPHGVGDDTAEGMEAFAHISRAVIQQIAHTVIKAEHGCRPG